MLTAEQLQAFGSIEFLLLAYVLGLAMDHVSWGAMESAHKFWSAVPCPDEQFRKKSQRIVDSHEHLVEEIKKIKAEQVGARSVAWTFVFCVPLCLLWSGWERDADLLKYAVISSVLALLAFYIQKRTLDSWRQRIEVISVSDEQDEPT